MTTPFAQNVCMKLGVEEFGMNHSQFAEFLTEATGVTINRAQVGAWIQGKFKPDDVLMYKIKRRTGQTRDWMVDGDGHRWHPDFAGALADVRNLAKLLPKILTPSERLKAVWDKLHDSYPEMPEIVWAAWLRLVSFPRGGIVSMGYWLSVKHGQHEPPQQSFEGASRLTGIDVGWFAGKETAGSRR